MFLASVSDGPVNLAQWRRIYRLTGSISISLPGPRRRLSAWLTRSVHRPAAERFLLQGTLDQKVSQWRRHHEFDLVLVTHSALRRSAWPIDAPLLQCDAATPSSTAHALRTLTQIAATPAAMPMVPARWREAA